MERNDNDAAKRPTKQGVSLNAAAPLLKDRLGSAAPARITLHRHSTSGQLSHLVINWLSTETRKVYDAEGLIAHYAAKINPAQGKEQQCQPSEAAAPLNAQSPGVDLEQLREDVIKAVTAEIKTTLQPLTETLASLNRQLKELSATRSALMLKYDAAAALPQLKLEAAQAELDRLRKESVGWMELTRLKADMSRILDAVQRLNPPR